MSSLPNIEFQKLMIKETGKKLSHLFGVVAGEGGGIYVCSNCVVWKLKINLRATINVLTREKR